MLFKPNRLLHFPNFLKYDTKFENVFKFSAKLIECLWIFQVKIKLFHSQH